MVKALAILAAAAALGPVQLPGARAVKACAAAGPYWPTMTLAIAGRSAWVACKEQSRLVRIDTATGRTVASVRLGTPPIAVVSGLGSVWALDSSGTLSRINRESAKVVKRLSLGLVAPYNLWIGGGSVWAADDQGASVVRVAPARNRVVARIPVGDGPADMAFDGGSGWVVNHRDKVLSRIDLRTNRSQRVTVLPGDAPERMVWSGGRLWITGRGTDLLKVDPADGSVEQTIEIGAGGIDVVANGDALWVPTRSAAVDQTGFPTMDALKRVSTATGAVSVVTEPDARLDVHGLVAAGGAVWLADNTGGYLYRVAA